ncbi:MAG: hypothetical protein WBA93_24945 [Microcoleaceae cyanobacterium]
MAIATKKAIQTVGKNTPSQHKKVVVHSNGTVRGGVWGVWE